MLDHDKISSILGSTYTKIKKVNPKILFVGHGRCGKDTACEYLSKITGLRNAGTTSKYFALHMSKLMGVSYEEAYARRHESDEMRTYWYEEANKLRENGPLTILNMALEHGDISGGLRDGEEIRAAREVVDIIIWIQNDRVPIDPTVKFTSRDADIVIENNWSLEEFYSRLDRLASIIWKKQ